MLRVPFFLYLGIRNFTKGGYERAAKSFDPSITTRDLKGVSAMVTGANQGIGYQVSLELAKRGSTLHMVCRNETRGKEAMEDIKKVTGNSDIHLHLCDVSSLASISKFGKEFESSGKPLQILVNNAGLMLHDGEKSIDGLEMNFAVNTLGTYALTKALEPVLRRSAPSRVIFVSSGGALTEALEVEDLEGAEKIKNKKDFGTIQYAKDKRRQLAIAERLAKEWKDAGITVVAMHPGWTETEGVKSSIPSFYNTFKDKMRTLPQGADTIVYLCVEEVEKIEPGAFYLDRKPQTKHLPLSGTGYNEEKVNTLIKSLDTMVRASGAVEK